MQRSLILLFLLLASGLSPAQTIDSLAQVDKLFSSWNNATPGVAVAIMRGDKVIYNKAFGLADLEHAVPNTTETVFESGSVAKQFTAMCILLLASEGKLSLQDDIRKYVPEIPQYNATITIQQLLNHTSGLKDWGSVGALTGWPRTTRVYTQDLALQIMSKQKSTNYTPGAEYSYSNSNYTLLTIIVERVSKQSLADFTDARLFKPLGMTHTKWRNNFHEVIPNRAIAYEKTSTTYEQLMPFENIYGHGGLLTTTGDLLKWNKLLETHALGGDKVYQERIKNGKLTNGTETNYAAGLFVGPVNNNYLQIAHSGATAGYRTWLAYYPAKRLSVVLLSNDGDFAPVQVGAQVADIFLGPEKNVKEKPKDVSLSDADWKRYDGIYRSVRHFDVQKLEYKDGKIMSNNHAVKAAHKDTLYLEGQQWVYRGPNRITVKGDEDTLSYVRVSPPDMTNGSLQSLIGAYKSDEADATYGVEIKNNEVWIHNKPFPAFKLTPSFRDGYFSDSFQLFEFKRDKKGKAVGFYISQSRSEKMYFGRD